MGLQRSGKKAQVNGREAGGMGSGSLAPEHHQRGSLGGGKGLRGAGVSPEALSRWRRVPCLVREGVNKAAVQGLLPQAELYSRWKAAGDRTPQWCQILPTATTASFPPTPNAERARQS